MTTSEACLACGPDSDWQKKICSIDGNAWCCDKRSDHALCQCAGEYSDYVFCPSSLGCGPYLFNFTNTTESIQAQITPNTSIDFCIYEIASDVERVITLKTNEWMTVFDPEYTRQTCLSYDCNITIRVTPGNDYYAMIFYPWLQDFFFEA